MVGAVVAGDEATLGRGWHASRARGFPLCVNIYVSAVKRSQFVMT